MKRSMRSCSTPPRATSAARCRGITTTPSPSPTMMSPGITAAPPQPIGTRSEEHTSELQSLMRISYAVFCLKKKNERRARHSLESGTSTLYNEHIQLNHDDHQ